MDEAHACQSVFQEGWSREVPVFGFRDFVKGGMSGKMERPLEDAMP